MVREVGGCGVRVLPEVQRNHVKKKEELKRKKEQIQQVVIDLLIINISVSTRYKKITLFISGQEFHLAHLRSQTERKTRIISPTCFSSYEIISIY